MAPVVMDSNSRGRTVGDPLLSGNPGRSGMEALYSENAEFWGCCELELLISAFTRETDVWKH